MTDLPSRLLQAALELTADRGALKDSAGRISAHYRERGASSGVIGGATDALAYALSRMPATYAAVSAVLEELQARAPGFVPAAMLDAGAGPGTAAWAAAEAFPGIAATLLDHNPAFLDLAGGLAAHAATGDVRLERGEIGRLGAVTRYDLVTCAYALTELGDAQAVAAAERLWAACGGVLAIVEPGRPRDYERLLAVRRRLVEVGGTIIAPCPQQGECPLTAPDWCHFSVRLSRSRAHMQMKGATLGFEDEKFSYLLVTRPTLGVPAGARVLRRPEENKFSVTLSLCTPHGLEKRVVASRDKAAFKQARKAGWGDAFE